jgi:hypothetical protein
VSKEEQKQPAKARRQTVHRILTTHNANLHHWRSSAPVFQVKEEEIIVNSPVDNALAKIMSKARGNYLLIRNAFGFLVGFG